MELFMYPCVIASKEEIEDMFHDNPNATLDPGDVWAYPEGFGDFFGQWFIPEPELIQPISEADQ